VPDVLPVVVAGEQPEEAVRDPRWAALDVLRTDPE
jgi:hypothetical protein